MTGERAARWMQTLLVLAGMVCLMVPAAMALRAWAGRAPPPKLSGVQTPIERPVLTAASVWSGAYARQFTAWFGRNDAAVPIAVAARNQAYFSVLGGSPVPEVVVGRGLELLESGYIAEYCSRNVAAMEAGIEGWAVRLAAMQRWYASQHRVFVYLMTPDKPATYPDDIPAGWPCHAAAADRAGMLPAWRASLVRHGVAFVDGPAIVEAAKAHYPFPLFARGGTHWNWVAGALTTQALVREINRQRPGSLADFTFTWQLSKPVETDVDLTDLLNLPYPRLDYTTPSVELQAEKPAGACHTPDIAAVGGSFTFHPLRLLSRLPCPPHIDFYTYFVVEHVTFPGLIRNPHIDPAARARLFLDTAEIVVLEENEERVFRAPHSEQLWDLVQPRIAVSEAAAR